MEGLSINTRQAIAICQIAGCKFTEEELADFEKVERGEMTDKDIIKKHLTYLAEKEKQHPENFTNPISLEPK